MRIIATVGGVVAPFVIEGILMIIQVESDWLMNMVLSIDPLGDVVLASRPLLFCIDSPGGRPWSRRTAW
jgi:hypothetical protein